MQLARCLTRVFALSLCLAAMSRESLGQIVVAHRGASAYAPENTLAAFKLAWELGADAAEGDFHLTTDGQIACCHDKTTERTGGQKLVIAESTFDELQAVEVGSWKDERFRGERIATLGDVLATVPAGKVFYVEVKCGPEIVPALAESIAASGLPSDRLRVIAFDKEVIRAVKQALPQYKAFWLSSLRRQKESQTWKPSLEDLVATAKEVGADGLDLQGVREVIDANFVRQCQDAALSVHVWTIDDPEVAVAFGRAGVASVTTNCPDTIRTGIDAVAGVESE